MDVVPEITAISQGIEVETLRASEGVSHHSLGGNLEAPEVLLAVGRVWEESLVTALETWLKEVEREGGTLVSFLTNWETTITPQIEQNFKYFKSIY